MTGLYWLDLHDEAEALSWAERYSRPLHAVPMEAVRKAVPSLGEGYERAVYMEGVANIRNPRLLQALRAALARLPNVTVVEHCPVERFLQDGSRVVGVRTAQGDMRAEQVVVAAGAWSAQLLATLGLQIPVKPMKGQMILFKCAEDFLPSMVLAKRRYAIPVATAISWSAARWRMSVSTRRPPRMRWKACERPQSNCCPRWPTRKWSSTGRVCVLVRQTVSLI